MQLILLGLKVRLHSSSLLVLTSKVSYDSSISFIVNSVFRSIVMPCVSRSWLSVRYSCNIWNTSARLTTDLGCSHIDRVWIRWCLDSYLVHCSSPASRWFVFFVAIVTWSLTVPSLLFNDHLLPWVGVITKVLLLGIIGNVDSLLWLIRVKLRVNHSVVLRYLRSKWKLLGCIDIVVILTLEVFASYCSSSVESVELVLVLLELVASYSAS
jgi:hypothetical protein